MPPDFSASGSGSGSGSGGSYSVSVSSSSILRRENKPRRRGLSSGSSCSSMTASTVLPTTSSREMGRGCSGSSRRSFSRSITSMEMRFADEESASLGAA